MFGRIATLFYSLDIRLSRFVDIKPSFRKICVRLKPTFLRNLYSTHSSLVFTLVLSGFTALYIVSGNTYCCSLIFLFVA